MNTTHQVIQRHEAGAIVAGQARLAASIQARVGAVASIRTRRAVATAQADKMQAALEAWAEAIYADLRYNLHPHSQAILVPAPWSRTHHRHYALSEPEGRLLAILLTDLLAMLPARRRLVEFDQVNRWVLNLAHFPQLADALAWLRGPARISADQVLEGWLKHPHGRRIVPPAGPSTGR